MKILIACESFFPEATGVSHVATVIAQGLAKLSHQVTVATSQALGSYEATSIDGIKVARFAVRGNHVRGLSGNVSDYVSFVRSDDSDLIVLHCAQTWTTDALLPHIQGLGKPVVLVSHGLSAYKDVAYKDYYSMLGNRLKDVGRVVGLSKRLEEVSFCLSYGLQTPAIIPNGVNFLEWEGGGIGMREKWGIGDRPWIVTVSNHSTVKNHIAFWHVVDRVANKLPTVRGSIIGRSYRAERFRSGAIGIKGGCWYKCLIRSLISDRTSLHKNALRKEVVSAIREAGVVLVTSHREAAPLVVLESMAAGTPWISFDLGSVRDNVGGIIVRSEIEMADTEAGLLQNLETAKELGRVGRQRIKERHDWNVIVRAHERLYAQCVLQQ